MADFNFRLNCILFYIYSTISQFLFNDKSMTLIKKMASRCMNQVISLFSTEETEIINVFVKLNGSFSKMYQNCVKNVSNLRIIF